MAFQLENIQKEKIKTLSSQEKESFLKKDIVLFDKPMSNKIKENFYLELGVLLKAGITLKNALELIGSSQKKKTTKAIFKTISSELISGKSFSETIFNRKHFTQYEYYSLKIGEETGTLEQVVFQLGQFFNRKNEQRRNVINAISYPLIILATAFLVLAFMLSFVVPMFEDIFKLQKMELPLLTQYVVDVSNFFKKYSWMLLIITIIILIGSKTFLNKKKWFKIFKDKLIVKTPILGQFTRIMYLAQFTQAVSLLTASKVSIINSIKLVGQMIEFYPLQKALLDIESRILKGSALSEAMNHHDLFGDKMVAMVKVAEETNQNEFIFHKLNEQYNIELHQRSKVLSTLLEPFIIFFVGAVVGIIVIAMYLPMFQLSSALG